MSVFKRAARSKARAAAETEAATFGRALDLAQVVIAQHRAAAVNDQWSALAEHDRCAVIAELDAEFAAAGCGCTCIDAGWHAETSRGYVTIVTRYPDIDIVAERGPGFSSSGRPMLRAAPGPSATPATSVASRRSPSLPPAGRSASPSQPTTSTSSSCDGPATVWSRSTSAA